MKSIGTCFDRDAVENQLLMSGMFSCELNSAYLIGLFLSPIVVNSACRTEIICILDWTSELKH